MTTACENVIGSTGCMSNKSIQENLTGTLQMEKKIVDRIIVYELCLQLYL